MYILYIFMNIYNTEKYVYFKYYCMWIIPIRNLSKLDKVVITLILY